MQYLAIHFKSFCECCLFSVDQSLRCNDHVVLYFSAINIYFTVEFVVHHLCYIDLFFSRCVVRNLVLNLLNASQSVALNLSPPRSLFFLPFTVFFYLVDLSVYFPVYVVVKISPYLLELFYICG